MSVKGILISSLVCFFASPTFAYTVSLQASNTTDIEVKTIGALSYEQNGNRIWQEPVPSMNMIIAQYGKNIPVDTVKKDLTSYDLEYFDFKDMNGKLLAMCLSTYYPVRENAILRFTLYKPVDSKNKYKCQRELIKIAAPS